MYFKTKKNSITGRRIAGVQKKLDACQAAVIKLSDELGFKQWRQNNNPFVAYGGISVVDFGTKKPDLKIWKEVRRGEFSPRKNTKEGKAMAKIFDALPIVSTKELNWCINDKEDFLHKVGYNLAGSRMYYGVSTMEEWGLKMPKDCEEITLTAYNKLFKKNVK